MIGKYTLPGNGMAVESAAFNRCWMGFIWISFVAAKRPKQRQRVIEFRKPDGWGKFFLSLPSQVHMISHDSHQQCHHRQYQQSTTCLDKKNLKEKMVKKKLLDNFSLFELIYTIKINK